MSLSNLSLLAACVVAALLQCPVAARAQLPAGGQLDAAFGSGGRAIATMPAFTSQAYAVDRQADGKLVVVGGAWGGGTSYRMVVARFTVAGVLDNTFGTAGFAVYGPTAGQTYTGRAVKVLGDGKILVAGDASSSAMLVRFLADGTVDPAFTVTPYFLGTNAQVTGMAVQTDGRVLVSAYAQRTGFSDNDGFVLRFLSGGTTDTNFGTSGRSTFGGSGEQTATAVVVQPDGKSLHTGTSSGTDMYVARLTTSGFLDTGFRSSGRTTISTASGSTVEHGRALALDGEGNILLAGQSNPGVAADVVVARLLTSGFLDTTFSADGWLLTDLGGSAGMPTGIAAQADTQILICGHRTTGSAGFALRRFYLNGDADLNFDTDGLATTAVGTTAAPSAGMLVQSDGKLVVAGTALEGGFLLGLAVARFEPGPALPPPVVTITQQPLAKTVNSGTMVTFSVTAEANVPVIYEWYRGTTLLTSGASASYGPFTAYPYLEGLYKVRLRYGAFSQYSDEVLLKVLQPPVVNPQADTAVTALQGQGLSLYASLSGRAPFSYKWYKGEAEVASVAVHHSTEVYLQLQGLSTNVGTYRLVVTNADGIATTGWYTVSLQADPSIRTPYAGKILTLGQNDSLYGDAFSSVDSRLQWNKNGVAVANARDSVLSINTAKITDAGVYTLLIRSIKGSAVSTPIKVGVVNVAAVSHVAALNKKFSMTVQAAGPDLTYQWFKGGQAVVADARVTGVASATLAFKTVETGDAGPYTCRVSGYGLDLETGTHAVATTATVPTIGSLTLPEAQVGVLYQHTPVLPALTTNFEITGLPAGFAYSKTENRITGKPTVAGTVVLKFTAVNPVGKSLAVSVPLVIAPLPTGMAGRFFGLMGEGGPVEGTFDLTIASTGAYSGKVQLCNMRGVVNTAAFSGVISVDLGDAGGSAPPDVFYLTANVPVAGIAPHITGPSLLSLEVRNAFVRAQLTIPYTEVDEPTSVTYEAYCSSYPWTAKVPLPAEYVGGFNLGLASQSSSLPAGSGYAKATVAAAGTLALAGKLSDGTALTSSMPVSVDFQVMGMTFLYGNKGRLSSALSLSPGSTAPEFLDAFVGGSFSWRKEANPASVASYPGGFTGSVSVLGGGKYLKPNLPVLTGPLMMNLPEGPNNLYVELMGVACYGTVGRGHTTKFSTSAETNPMKLTALTFNAGTGTFTASSNYSFYETRYDDEGNPYEFLVKKPFTVLGMVVREGAALSSTGAGFGLVSETILVSNNPVRFAQTMFSFPVGLNAGF